MSCVCDFCHYCDKTHEEDPCVKCKVIHKNRKKNYYKPTVYTKEQIKEILTGNGSTSKKEEFPRMHYVQANCFKWTFDDKKIRKIVEKHCKGIDVVLNLFAGKNRLNIKKEIRVDISDEFKPDYHMSASEYLKIAKKERKEFKLIIYDPPWNERKSKEFYNGYYINQMKPGPDGTIQLTKKKMRGKGIGTYTKLKNDIVSILHREGIIISVGYEVTNFGRERDMELTDVYVIDSKGEIRPYFISVEKKKYHPSLLDHIPGKDDIICPRCNSINVGKYRWNHNLCQCLNCEYFFEKKEEQQTEV